MSILRSIVQTARKHLCHDTVADVEDLDAYLNKYGQYLGESAQNALKPLHIPGRDAAIDFSEMPRNPFNPQAHVITAAVKSLDRQKSILLVCEMGTGKTLMGMQAAHSHAKGKPYRALIFCPGQLVNKWERELRETITGVDVHQLRDWRDVIKLRRGDKPTKPAWYVISRDRAKLGAKWRAVKTKDRRGIGVCPLCNWSILNPKTQSPIPFATLSKKKHFCENCEQPLWTYTHELKRWEPALYIKRKLKGFFHYLIVDECFPGDTLISTESGQRPIKDIMPGDRVWSMKDGGMVLRTVVRRIKKTTANRLVEVAHDFGSFRCTPNHKIWTTGGYVAASRLCDKDVLVIQDGAIYADHRQGVSDLPKSVSMLAEGDSRREDLQRLVRARVEETESAAAEDGQREAAQEAAYQGSANYVRTLRRGKDGRCEGYGPSLLREVLLCEGEMEIEQLSRKDHPKDEQEREFPSSFVGVDEGTEFSPGSERKGKCCEAGPQVRRGERREWITHATATSPTARLGMAEELPGISNSDDNRKVVGDGCGYRASKDAHSNRSGRRIAQLHETEEQRQNQDGISRIGRMDRAPVLELRSGRTDRGMPRQSGVGGTSRVRSVGVVRETEREVYDLEIEDTHCYFANGVLVSNCHQEKSSESAQANAVGSLAAASGKVIGLTGTLIGGYAEHIRPLLYRLAPKSIVEEGLAWEEYMAFNERYGRIETRITEKESHSLNDNSQSRGSKRQTNKIVRPGIMPSLFGRHLIDKAIFLSLEELADNLPPLAEEVIGVNMDAEVAPVYAKIEEDLRAAVKEMGPGDKRLLGKMLQVLLGYPDHPHGYGEIGFYDENQWVSVTDCPDLDAEKLRPKEKALLKLALAEHDEGRQLWVYCQMTDKRDVLKRLEGLMQDRGLRVKVLRSSVKLSDREEWIERHGRSVDVVLSHPQLVETGLDLFDKRGGHNFCSLAFYETGYNLFTLRQASRRAWRIGQQKACKVFYFYYNGTMQERAMTLMGRKMTAAAALEGKFSSEGLAAMAGEDASIELAMARSLANKINDMDAARAWEKVASRPQPSRALEELPVLALKADPAVAVKPLVAQSRSKRHAGRSRISGQQLSFLFD